MVGNDESTDRPPGPHEVTPRDRKGGKGATGGGAVAIPQVPRERTGGFDGERGPSIVYRHIVKHQMRRETKKSPA